MEGGGGQVLANMGRRSSIENEPKTLSIDQIQCAREAALYVVKSRSIEEAMGIFLEGLKPVTSSAEPDDDDDDVSTVMWDDDDDVGCMEEHVQPPARRDILSAPF